MQQTFIRIISCCYRFVEDLSTWTAKTSYKNGYKKYLHVPLFSNQTFARQYVSFLQYQFFAIMWHHIAKEKIYGKKEKQRKLYLELTIPFIQVSCN